jgi:hypothetical protein
MIANFYINVMSDRGKNGVFARKFEGFIHEWIKPSRKMRSVFLDDHYRECGDDPLPELLTEQTPQGASSASAGRFKGIKNEAIIRTRASLEMSYQPIKIF